MKDAWVLRLKKESKEEWMNPEKDYYLTDKEENEFLTDELNEAQLIDDKEEQIEEMKRYEEYMEKRFGDIAICNFGYTNIMENFDFAEVTVKNRL
jgi:hypothetical protein